MLQSNLEKSIFFTSVPQVIEKGFSILDQSNNNRRYFLKKIFCSVVTLKVFSPASVLLFFSQKTFAHFVPFGFWKKQGTAWGWGYNGGNLGDSTTIDRSAPTQVGALRNWNGLSAGCVHAVGIKTEGTLWAWGNNDSGNLGVSGGLRNSPVQVGSASDWKMAVAAGDYYGSAHLYTVAVKTDGTLYCWGDNSAGQLGDGTRTTKSSPLQIGTDTNWAWVSAASGLHTMAIKTDGTLWAWGKGADGRLGCGDTNSRSSPIQIGALTDWVKVWAGESHTVALKSNNSLWTWGGNNAGQLGAVGSARSSPVQLNADTDWALASAGANSCYAIKTSGALWVWGSNYNGQLGTGNVLDKFSPTQISGLSWKDIDGGFSHVLATKTDKSLWAWGDNAFGFLGDGTIVSKSSPIQIGSSNNWDKISAGESFSIAIQS